MDEQHVVVRREGMESCPVRRNLVYKTAEDTELKFDLYYPAHYDGTSLLPAVIFAHGEAPWEVLYNAKDWGQYTGWGQLAASAGIVGITFTRRPSAGFTELKTASGDVNDFFEHMSKHAEDFGVDTERLALWVCSAGGPAALSVALQERVLRFKAVAALYTLMNLTHIDELQGEISSSEARHYSPIWALHDRPSEEVPPMMVVRAGRDNEVINQSIDDFTAKCFARNLPITVVNHKDGQHGFDVRDNTSMSRYVIDSVLLFLGYHLHGSAN
ncbi:alpha/beta hydrolase [Alicyclobacillus sp. SO9]|uniref:alpha/beta hydrolase n=1 Tax=Alicyclobacillus sp. SO9 TaxID=2665646 RepID=UPI0018E8F6AF|nr:alpha/beta hydrolase [Alicyclobacillus sp. SO9]QQE81020.1 prolyl oligopeptidase family serine peptidase [Alicyclobacillus sp. SO9]